MPMSAYEFSPKPFRFESLWTRDPFTAKVNAESLSSQFFGTPLHILNSKLTNTKLVLKCWNGNTFGHVQTSIKTLSRDIKSIQTLPFTQSTLKKEADAQLELNGKFKCKWIADGDANTRYFHILSIIKCKFNAIEHIKFPHYTWLKDRTRIGAKFVDYYKDFFYSIFPHSPNDLYDFIVPIVTLENVDICRIFDEREIKNAVFSMSARKSPSPDGFIPFFYKTYWHIVHDSIIHVVQFFFEHGHLIKGINHTFLTLIPKT